MYLTRVLLRLNPTLYPRCLPFIVEPLRTSLFEPLLAGMVHLHIALPWAMILLQLAALALTLTAALALMRRITEDLQAQLAGIALLAAWTTVPVAGTSLLLFDPYLTARTLCAPFTLFAAAFAMDSWGPSRVHSRRPPRGGTRSAIACAASLLLGFAFHPLMATYGTGLVVMLRLARTHRATLWMAVASCAALLIAAAMQLASAPSSAAVLAADTSRYYWFLSRWQWFELLGIIGPAIILLAFATQRLANFKPGTRLLARAALGLLASGVLVALCCGQEHFAAHPIARLQPLRVLWSVYALLPLLLGASLASRARVLASKQRSQTVRSALRFMPTGVIATTALIFLLAQCGSFPASPHIELPGRTNSNPWVQAFVWSRDHTANTALFALDARYVNRDGEDAQNFRAISLRSSLPDFSKDGGEAAIRASLADSWLPAAEAQRDLIALTPAEREARLRPFAPDWLILASTAKTTSPCPYDNGTVKVCRM